MVAWVCDPLKGKQGQVSLHCMHAWRLQKTRKQPAGTLTSANCTRIKHREEKSSESKTTLIFFALHSLMTTTTTNLHLKRWRWADFQHKPCMLHSAKPLCADPTLQHDYLSPCRAALQSIIQCVCYYMVTAAPVCDTTITPVFDNNKAAMSFHATGIFKWLQHGLNIKPGSFHIAAKLNCARRAEPLTCFWSKTLASFPLNERRLKC